MDEVPHLDKERTDHRYPKEKSWATHYCTAVKEKYQVPLSQMFPEFVRVALFEWLSVSL